MMFLNGGNMKLFKIQIVLALLFIGVGNAVCATDLNGVWKSDIETMIIYQNGNEIKAMCSINYNSRPAILYGEGTIRDNQVKVHFQFSPVTLPSGWEEKGTLIAIVSPDGNSLSGKWEVESGGWSGPAALKRAGS
jgi:hypothetical protein